MKPNVSFLWKMKGISLRPVVAFSFVSTQFRNARIFSFLSQSTFAGFVEPKEHRKIHCTILVFVREVLNLYIKTGT